MVLMPGSDANVLEVEIRGDGSNLERALAGSQAGVLNLRTAVLGLGAALVGVAAGGFAVAIGAAADFEQAMVELEKVTDPAIAAEMGDAIMEMAEEIPLAQEELAGIAAQAGRLGIEGVENIREFTRVAAEMAIATDLTADEAANSFARITQLIGLPIENVRDLGNMINELSNTMATTSSEITDSVLRSGAALTQMGLSSEEIVAVSAALNEVSESSERAGTRLRSMALEFQSMGEEEMGALAEIAGVSTEELTRMRDEAPLEFIRTMATVFADGGEGAQLLGQELSRVNQQALRGLAQNLEGLDSALETSTQQMENGASLSEEFAAATDTFNSRLQTTENRIRNIAITTGERLLPAMTGLLEEVNSILGGLAALNERTDGTAGTMALAATGVAGLVAILAALGSPVLAVAGAIAALGAIWTTNFADIQGRTREAWDQIQAILGANLPELIEATQGLLEKGRAFWAEYGDEIEAVAGVIFDVIVLGLVTWFDFAISTITGLLQLLNGDTEGALDTWVGFWARTINRVTRILDEWSGGALTDFANTIITAINNVGVALDRIAAKTPGVSFDFERIETVDFSPSQSAATPAARHSPPNPTPREQTVNVQGKIVDEDGTVAVIVDDQVSAAEGRRESRRDRLGRGTF